VDLLTQLGVLAVAVLMGSAGIQKARRLPATEDYLRKPFGSIARQVAWGAIVFEVILAFALVASLAATPLSIAAGLLMASGAYVVAATVILAYRLTPIDETWCGCWGGEAPTRTLVRTGRDRRALEYARPALYATRNASMTTLAVGLAGKLYLSSVDSAVMAAVYALCPAIVAVGLVRSIVKRRRMVGVPNHPRLKELAPRLEPLAALWWHGGGWLMKSERHLVVHGDQTPTLATDRPA